jgi:hypothetical protein
MSLSQSVRTAIEAQVTNTTLVTDTFVLDSAEFQRHAAYASKELDNGAMLTAPADRFDECFNREAINGQDERYRFTTEGRVVDERLKARR